MAYASALGTESKVPDRLHDPSGLNGRLELAYLSMRGTDPHTAIGNLLNHDEKVLVRNGMHSLGELCLVRFDLEGMVNPTSSNSDVDTLFGESDALFFEDGPLDDSNVYP
ncbi:hypothetical protein CMO93_01090 [Candidatus Woesearchaeota archaeon]|nr:hypothetical protein [Candidatus Woesearchaeota archaeon]|tara:strand:- start:552 stop:881 length:330 start_codon:yes stop_codon:yes gene_type:complete